MKKRLFLKALLLICFSSAAFALKSDENVPAYISAESAEMDRSTGEGIYRHEVKIDQGTTHITGEIVTTHNDKNNKIDEAVVNGNASSQAHYWTLPEADKPELHARADVIRFYPQKQLVLLIGNASVAQGNNIIKSPRIEYDIEKQLLKSNQEPGKASARTTIIINPNEGKGDLVAPRPKEPKGKKP